jgi:hypothetical protein
MIIGSLEEFVEGKVIGRRGGFGQHHGRLTVRVAEGSSEAVGEKRGLISEGASRTGARLTMALVAGVHFVVAAAVVEAAVRVVAVVLL